MKSINKYFVLLVLSYLISPEFLYSQPDPEWVNRFNGEGNSYDIVANMGKDKAGNIYVYGSSNSAVSLYDFALIKYKTSGAEIWTAKYNGKGNSTDQIFKGYTDQDGNSFVTGFISDISGGNIITTAKYDSSGELNWMRFFSPSGYYNGSGQDITLDKNGNVIVCGYIRNATGNYDIVTLKYSDIGTELSSDIYNGTGNGDDNPVSVKSDNFNNIIVTGSTKEISAGADILVIKYDTSLNVLWKRTFDGSINSEDKASSSVMDDDNSVYICGSVLNNPGSYDYFYAKIDQNGNTVWQGFFNGTGNYKDISYAITKDLSGNIFITGVSFHNTGFGSEDILTLKISPEGILLWSAVFNGAANGTDQGIDVTTDIDGNIYIGGGSDMGNVHLIYALLKYDPDGNFLWVKNYENNSVSEDFISVVLVDSSFNIFVTGISIGNGTNFDIVTIMYSQTTGILSNANIVPNGFYLYQNFPNPFNPSTNFRFQIPESEKSKLLVSLKIYNVSGKEVSTIINENKSSGYYSLIFNASGFPSGVYYYKLSVTGGKENFSDTKKMILIR